MTEIGVNAFASCTALNEVYLPDGITSIGTGAFYNIGSNASIFAAIGSDSAEAVSKANYKFCVEESNSAQLYYTFSGDEAVSLCAVMKSAFITNVVIPGGVTELPANSFKSATRMNVAVIPDSVVTIADSAFPKAHENLIVGCTSYARTWAEGAGYPQTTEEGGSSYSYQPVHGDGVADPGVDPSCTETGLTEGSHCAACGDILIAQETVEALGNLWADPVYNWAEGMDSVTAEHVCERDDSHTETETVLTYSMGPGCIPH